jgi:hypothetical protein
MGFAAPSPAAAASVADASCPGPASSFQTVPGQFRFAQVFTAQRSGSLTRVEVTLSQVGTPADWTLTVNAVDPAGAPTNTVLTSTTIPDSAVPPGQNLISVDLASPLEVTAGDLYALVITRPGSNFMGTGFRTDDPCSGVLWTSNTQAGAFSPACGPAANCDLVFTVFVDPPPAERSVSLEASKAKVKKRKKVTLSGVVQATPDDPACESGQTVEIQRTGLKGGTPIPVTTAQTDGQGAFIAEVKMKKSSLFTARLPETADCSAAASAEREVRVRKRKR